MAARLDVNLERLSELDAALLKSGEAVTLREGDDGILTVETSDSGLLLGGVAAEHAAALAGSEFVGHVRTLKKNSDTNIISGVTVRFVRGERSIRPIGKLNLTFPPHWSFFLATTTTSLSDRLVCLNSNVCLRYLLSFTEVWRNTRSFTQIKRIEERNA